LPHSLFIRFTTADAAGQRRDIVGCCISVSICAIAKLRPVMMRSILVEQITSVWPVNTSGSMG
jgi:hypothetical protein